MTRAPTASACLLLLLGGCGGGRHVSAGPAAVDLGPPTGGSADDLDGDGYSPAAGDCNDHDATVHPGAAELCDARDHNCNGMIDETCDVDRDGYNACPGGDARCQPPSGKNGLPGGDCDDRDDRANPGAIELVGNHLDDNCNGQVDEAPVPCDAAVANPGGRDYAGALELCPPWLVAASFNNDGDARAHSLRTAYGQGYHPKAGRSFIMLSTGLALDKSDPGFVPPQTGTEFGYLDANPHPTGYTSPQCHDAHIHDEDPIHDYTELTIALRVPSNAHSIAFDFLFVSSEYPEYIDVDYNDKFLALLTTAALGRHETNISFDAGKRAITVNTSLFTVCQSADDVCHDLMHPVPNICPQPVNELAGTGMEDDDGYGQPIGGGTGWLSTQAPVSPGETARLRLIVFDEGDDRFDSSVIIDNLRFQAASLDAPSTNPVP